MSENRSRAQVIARASFSIWAYRFSVSDMERDAKATGLHSEAGFCIRTAPRPYEEASVDILVETLGS